MFKLRFQVLNHFRNPLLSLLRNEVLGESGFCSIASNPVFEELYNLKNDPCETKNLKNDPLYANVLDSMRIKLKEFRNLYR